MQTSDGLDCCRASTFHPAFFLAIRNVSPIMLHCGNNVSGTLPLFDLLQLLIYFHIHRTIET